MTLPLQLLLIQVLDLAKRRRSEIQTGPSLRLRLLAIWSLERLRNVFSDPVQELETEFAKAQQDLLRPAVANDYDERAQLREMAQRRYQEVKALSHPALRKNILRDLEEIGQLDPEMRDYVYEHLCLSRNQIVIDPSQDATELMLQCNYSV